MVTNSELVDAATERDATTPLIDMSALKAAIPLADLRHWMEKHHAELRTATAAKADEYGSLDLKMMGATLAQVMPGLADDEATQVQAAIAFYALGKISRVFSALAEGKPAPTDSWLDLEVYALMAQRVLETGQWP